MLDGMLSDEQLKIRVHHIGGIGNCGPTEALHVYGNDIEWVMYDADDSALSAMNELKNKKYTLVNKCIGARNEKKKFNITLGQSASSTLPSAPSAAQYSYFEDYDKIMIWGKHTQIVKLVDTEVDSINALVEQKKVPPVDFLSIDAQGSELDIIEGASLMLSSSIVGILCEVEFAELYSKQPLFCDIQDRLHKDGFRLCELMGVQRFNAYPFVKELQGKGFYTVDEALFLKEPHELIDAPEGYFDELSPGSLFR